MSYQWRHSCASRTCVFNVDICRPHLKHLPVTAFGLLHVALNKYTLSSITNIVGKSTIKSPVTYLGTITTELYPCYPRQIYARNHGPTYLCLNPTHSCLRFSLSPDKMRDTPAGGRMLNNGASEPCPFANSTHDTQVPCLTGWLQQDFCFTVVPSVVRHPLVRASSSKFRTIHHSGALTSVKREESPVFCRDDPGCACCDPVALV